MLYSHLPTSPKQSPNYVLYVAAGAVVILVGIGSLLYATNHLPFLHRTAALPSAHSTGDNGAKGEPATSTSSQPTTAPSDSSKNGDDTGAKTLIAPTGNFVSSHHVTAASPIASTCTTTPGATCQIIFTKDGVTQSLPAQTTDAGGSTYWNNWRPQDYYLGPGTWAIQAVATLGNQSLHTNDALQLEVTP